MNDRDYALMPGVRQSDLKWLRDCPAMYKYRMDNPLPTSESMLIGSAVDCLVLTPNEWQEEFTVAPECDRRTKDGKAAYAEFISRAYGRTVLSADQMRRASGIASAVKAYDFARGMKLENVQAAYTWRDAGSDMPCKAKVDFTAEQWCYDLKTCSDNSPRGFERALSEYGYHIQAAFYLDGLRANGIDCCNGFVFLTVRNTEPYLVCEYQLSASAIRQGRREYRELLRLLDRCERSGEWPGYGYGMVDLPRYAQDEEYLEG